MGILSGEVSLGRLRLTVDSLGEWWWGEERHSLIAGRRLIYYSATLAFWWAFWAGVLASHHTTGLCALDSHVAISRRDRWTQKQAREKASASLARPTWASRNLVIPRYILRG